MTRYDIIIVGGGIVGLTAALALAKSTSLKLAIIDDKSPLNTPEVNRVSAISLCSQKIFQHLNNWERIPSDNISAYRDMQVWDSISQGQIHFDCQSLGEEALGFIIPDESIRQSLYHSLKHYPHCEHLSPIKLHSLKKHSDTIELVTNNQQTFQASLVIAADGANSFIRNQCDIQLTSWDYGQTAIIATVTTTKPHQNTAWQRFLPTGPLAFLPLNFPHVSSLVWSVDTDYAKELLVLDDTAFLSTLSKAFNHTLGDTVSITGRAHFPLKMRHAKHYVQERIALIGDAAHTLHPLAGQGMNIGIRDAMKIAEVILTALHKKRGYSSLFTLRQYERARKGDVYLMLGVVESLKRLFSPKNNLIVHARGLGLTIMNQLPFIKNLLIQQATGKFKNNPLC